MRVWPNFTGSDGLSLNGAGYEVWAASLAMGSEALEAARHAGQAAKAGGQAAAWGGVASLVESPLVRGALHGP